VEIADYVFVLDNGETIAGGSKDEIFNDSGLLEKAEIDHPCTIIRRLESKFSTL